MARYLSDAWIAEVHDALAADAGVRDAATGDRLVVEQRVDDAVYHLSVDERSVAVRSGPAAEADVRFAQDRSTAVAIARGERSIHDAFMAGALRVSGDVGVLAGRQPLFRAIDGALDEVRARTDYGPG